MSRTIRLGSSGAHPFLSVVMILMLDLILGAGRASGAITIEGVRDRTGYNDTASFRVVTAAGSAYTATLNGVPVPTGILVPVDQTGFFELVANRVPDGGGAPETLTIHFVVNPTERGTTEFGLHPKILHPPIPSADAEFAGAHLTIVAPASYPLGLEMPVVAWVEDSLGERVGVNGNVTFPAFPDDPMQLFRGVGSALLPPASVAGTLPFDALVGPLSASRDVIVEATTSWNSVSGTLSASTNWGADARIRVTGALTVAAGATLTVGAGSVIEVSPGVTIVVKGNLVVNGSRERPVVFTPQSPSSPWGGFIVDAGTPGADRVVATGAIFTGAGANPDWFVSDPDRDRGSSHRHEQPVFWYGSGVTAKLTDCYIIDSKGQGGHGEGGIITLTRCLVQRATTNGQYNGGKVTLDRTALIEFPYAGAPFVDGDNDAMYLVGGTGHSLTRCLVGWTQDDCIDGGGGDGPMTFTDCWFESCVHEGYAMSTANQRTIRGAVVLDCGQGIECGYGSEYVDADDCLSTGNIVGARFGDCYDWDYTGTLDVKGSLLIFNEKDIWAQTFDNDTSSNPRWWTHLDAAPPQVIAEDNWVTIPYAPRPNNSLWNPAADASLLTPFLPVPDDVVGVGLATWSEKVDATQMRREVPVRLSTFTRKTVSVDYSVAAGTTTVDSGTVEFLPGQQLKMVPVDPAVFDAHPAIRVTLANPVNAQLTGRSEIYSVGKVTLVPMGSTWRYFDKGQDLGTAWRLPDFDETSWKEGKGELGYGDGDEATVIQGGPDGAKYPTSYFRKKIDVPDPAAFESVSLRIKRDDGAVIYLNGTEIHRGGMPAGGILYSTWATENAENLVESAAVPLADLVAGANTIAVEVHQRAADSSDVSFDFELTAEPVSSPPVTGAFVRSDANGDGTVDISDAVRVLLVLFGGMSIDCEDALDADDSGTLEITDAIFLLRYLFSGESAPPAPFPSAGLDPSQDDLGCNR